MEQSVTMNMSLSQTKLTNYLTGIELYFIATETLTENVYTEMAKLKIPQSPMYKFLTINFYGRVKLASD